MAHEIVPATEALLAEVETWLDNEEAQYQIAEQAWEAAGYSEERPVRGFRCNWDTAKRFWREGRARIDVLLVDGKAAGFLDGTDILEIRPDLRRSGYGRIFAEFMLDAAHTAGYSVIEIGIAPASAEPFWRSMGFTIVPEREGRGGGIYAYQMLPRAFILTDGARAPFSIAFYSEDERYSGSPKPFACYSGMGERLAGGEVQLPERAICFDPEDDKNRDYFVRIQLDGEQVHFDKVKYETSKALGVERDPSYTYFIDRLRSASRST
jgi:GNAT superfamily N-acetyltransferase